MSHNHELQNILLIQILFRIKDDVLINNQILRNNKLRIQIKLK